MEYCDCSIAYFGSELSPYHYQESLQTDWRHRGKYDIGPYWVEDKYTSLGKQNFIKLYSIKRVGHDSGHTFGETSNLRIQW
jgi:hypothetical protein